MYAYAQAPPEEDTIKFTSFSSGDKLLAFIRGFYGLKGLLNFFTKQMSSFFETLIEQGFALVYTPWKWTDEHEQLFQKSKTSLTSETELTIPNTKHRFFITVDVSLVGLGAVLFHLNEQNKLKVISYNSRILNPQEKKTFNT